MRPPDTPSKRWFTSVSTARFERDVERLAQTHDVQQADVESDFVVMGVVAVGAGPAHAGERHEVPRALLLVAAHGVREVPQSVRMQVRHAELLLKPVAVLLFRVHGSGGSPAFGLQSGVPDARADRGGEPFADVNVQRRSQPFAEFSLRVVLAEIEVYTSGDADENVVGEPVGFVGAAYDAVLRIPVAVLLRRSAAADEGE